MILWCVIAAAVWAAAPPEVEARLAEVEHLRELRIMKAAPRPSAADVRHAAQGTIVTDADGNRAWATAVLNVSIGLLWSAVNDETRHPGFTAVAYSELLQGRVCKSGRMVLQYLPIPVPMVSDRWWIGVLRQNDALSSESGGSVRELSWKSETDPSLVTTSSGQKIIGKAEPIGSTRGAWFFVAIDRFSTYLEYFSKTDPGSGVPSSVTSRLAEGGVRDTVKAMERFSKEGNPVCPIY